MLFIGLGGGSAPKRMWRDFPELRLQVVELDPDVVDAAYRWFELPRDPRLAVDVDDGRRWLTRNDKRWDVIVIDAFYADSIPFHLATREFLQLVRERLDAGRRRRRQRDRRAHRRRVEAPALADEDLPLVVPDGARSTRSSTRSTTTIPTYIRNVILVATDSAAPVDGVPARALAGDQEGRARSRRTSTARSRTAGAGACASTTCPC